MSRIAIKCPRSEQVAYEFLCFVRSPCEFLSHCFLSGFLAVVSIIVQCTCKPNNVMHIHTYVHAYINTCVYLFLFSVDIDSCMCTLSEYHV